ncbi:MAG: GNAT family N-acetyltransferase [Gemmatimonadaceae bacterium]
MTVLIRSPRLTLRPLIADDLDRFYALNRDAGVRRFLFDGDESTREEVRERLLDRSLRLWTSEGAGLFGIARAARDELIGWAGFWCFHEPPVREIGYAVHPDHWGQGIAGEAARAVMAYGAAVLGDRTFRASTDAPNEASIRVLNKLGFTEERRSPGRLHETVHFSRPLAGVPIDDIVVVPAP